jgi:ferredoxin-NADP reductase
LNPVTLRCHLKWNIIASKRQKWLKEMVESVRDQTPTGRPGRTGTTASQEPRRRIHEIEVEVAEARMDSPDTASLFLSSVEPFEYSAGHFLTIDPHQFQILEHLTAFLEDLKGTKEKPRAYSLGSAPHEKYVLITIKEERYVSGETKYPPLLSPLLTYHCPVGTKMTIKGFTGAYTFPEDITDRTDNIVHVCAGSGVVPNLGLIKHSLFVNDGLRHTLLFSNKTRDDIIYFDDFRKLSEQHPDKLEVIHCITREDPSSIPKARRGRIDEELLREYIPDPGNCFAFSCGPGILPHERKEAKEKGETPTPKFVENMVALLHEAGLDKNQLKQESWG